MYFNLNNKDLKKIEELNLSIEEIRLWLSNWKVYENGSYIIISKNIQEQILNEIILRKRLLKIEKIKSIIYAF